MIILYLIIMIYNASFETIRCFNVISVTVRTIIITYIDQTSNQALAFVSYSGDNRGALDNPIRSARIDRC